MSLHANLPLINTLVILQWCCCISSTCGSTLVVWMWLALSGFICRKFTWLAQTISTQSFSAHLVLEHMLYELAAQSCDMMLHEVRWGCFLSGALKGAPHLRIQFNNILPNIRSFSALTFFFFFYHMNPSSTCVFNSVHQHFPVTMTVTMTAGGELDLSLPLRFLLSPIHPCVLSLCLTSH